MTGRVRKPFLVILILLFVTVFRLTALPLSFRQLEEPVDDYLQSLPAMQRMSLLFLVNIDGNGRYRALEYDDEGLPLVPGGCLFFSYNVASTAAGIISFTDAIAAYCDRHHVPRPYVAIDQEGGDVNRLRNLTSSLPSPLQVSRFLTPHEAAKLYGLQGAQMAALGFDLNLAPVVESAAPYNGEFLARRVYGSAAEAAAFSSVAVRAYQSQGIMCAVKHFPGNSNADPHTGMSVMDIDRMSLAFSLDLPLSVVFASEPAAVVMSHAVVPAVDPDDPAVLSRKWIMDILRGSFGYTGLVISDDIFMGALSSFERPDLAVRAIRAGADVLMISDKYFKEYARALVSEAERDLPFAALVREAQRHVVLFKLRAGLLCLQESADGNLKLVEVPLAGQRGSDEVRLRTFLDAKEIGTEFYVCHFSGGQP